MAVLRVALATVRRPKVEGAKAAFATVSPLLGIDATAIDWVTRETPSGVDETPTQLDHLLQGARGRVQALRQGLVAEGGAAQYYVGLEGGLWAAQGSVFLQSWAYVTDGVGESFGASGAIAVPGALAEAVLGQGRSLGEVIDVFAGERNVRSGQGAWGVLSRGHMTRERSFETALVNALAPFFNAEVYGRTLG